MGHPRTSGAVREAVILAGGRGTRMWPLTASRPKHLLDVGGVPLLAHQLARLAGAGVEHVVVATAYHPEQFAPVLGDGSRWGLRVTYVREPVPLGTGGALRHAASGLAARAGDPVLVLNGDVLSGHALEAQARDFDLARDGCVPEVSLHLVHVEDPRAFGCVPTDDRGRVTAFLEKTAAPPTRQVNAGCYLFRRFVVDQIPSGRVVSVERETFPALLAADRLVVGHREDAYWRDVGTPAALVAAARDVVDGRYASPAVGPAPRSARIDPAALVDGAEVGAGSVVMGDALVEAGAEVSGSVVMTGAVVRAGASVRDSVLGPASEVGEAARVLRSALGERARVGPGVVLAPGTAVGPGETVEGV